MAKTPKTLNGWHRYNCGYETRLDGAIVPIRFYTSKTLADHRKQCKEIKARWLALKAQGLRAWPPHELQRLEADGLVRPKDQKAVQREIAKKLITDLHVDPLEPSDLQKYADANGAIKPECAPIIPELLARKLEGRLDVRCALYNQMYLEMLRDPMGTLERCSRLFGWYAKDTQKFLFNVQGGMSMNPIAFDASETDKHGANPLDAIEGETVGENVRDTD